MKKIFLMLITTFLFILLSGCQEKEITSMTVDGKKYNYNKELIELIDAKEHGEKRIGWLKHQPDMVIEVQAKSRNDIYHLYDYFNVDSYLIQLKSNDKFYELTVQNDKEYAKIKSIITQY